MLTKVRFAPSPLGPTTALRILLFSLVPRKFASTPLLDRSLTFNAYLKKLTAFLTSSIRIIRATAHTSWGWHHSTLKMAFHTLIRRKLDYAAPAWQPWLSDTNLSCLDFLQNCSLRLTMDELVSTPLKALQLEADVQSYPTCWRKGTTQYRGSS